LFGTDFKPLFLDQFLGRTKKGKPLGEWKFGHPKVPLYGNNPTVISKLPLEVTIALDIRQIRRRPCGTIFAES
jgi:hypothetical protein